MCVTGTRGRSRGTFSDVVCTRNIFTSAPQGQRSSRNKSTKIGYRWLYLINVVRNWFKLIMVVKTQQKSLKTLKKKNEEGIIGYRKRTTYPR